MRSGSCGRRVWAAPEQIACDSLRRRGGDHRHFLFALAKKKHKKRRPEGRLFSCFPFLLEQCHAAVDVIDIEISDRFAIAQWRRWWWGPDVHDCVESEARPVDPVSHALSL